MQHIIYNYSEKFDKFTLWYRIQIPEGKFVIINHYLIFVLRSLIFADTEVLIDPRFLVY